MLQLQQRNASFVQGWLNGGVGILRDHTEHNLRTADAFALSARKQLEGLQTLGREWVGAYQSFFSPFAYAREDLRAAQQGLQATQHGLRVVEKATERTDEVLRQTEEATRDAELRSAVHGELKVENYEELNVEEVPKKLDGLPVGELKKVREYQKRNKGRETLIGQINRKIKAARRVGPIDPGFRGPRIIRGPFSCPVVNPGDPGASRRSPRVAIRRRGLLRPSVYSASGT